MKRILFVIVMLLCVAIFVLPAMATETECAHANYYYSKADDYHYMYCSDCGSMIGVDTHTTSCISDTGLCTACGAATTNLSHKWGYAYNDTYHWSVCQDCGLSTEEDEKEEHVADCTSDKTTCKWCGGAASNPVLSHNEQDNAYDDQYHWNECLLCGETLTKYVHYNSCATSYGDTQCEECPYDNVPMTHIFYPGNPAEIVKQYNETAHWDWCTYCENEVENTRVSHTVSCAAPGVCTGCGATDCTNEIVHVGPTDDTWYSNDSYHFQICDGCGKELRSAHSDQYIYSSYNDTHHMMRCDVCGYTVGFEEHYAPCNGDGSCIMCGGASAEVRHSWVKDYDQDNHWSICTNCDSYVIDDEEGHVAYCNAATTCYICNASGINVEIVHPDKEQFYDDTHHWYTCHTCNTENVEKQAHYADCGSGMDTCVQCESTNTDIAIIHGFSEQQSDATSHWMFCLSCEENYNVTAHTISCADLGVCTECGATDCTNEVMHSFEVVYDETKHWEECSVCGEIGWEGGEHYNVCISGLPLGRCVECDYDQVTTFYHTYDGGTPGETPQTTWNHNETECWKECVGCNAEMADTRFPHHTSCQNPGVCTACGTEVGDDVEMMHYRYADTPYEYDETHHWFICVMCNEQAMKGEHKFRESARDESKIVYTCGCGATKEEQLHVEHVWIETAREDASCGVKGEVVYICECGETKTEEIPALEHSYTTTETPAACGVEGKKVTACTLCGDASTEVIPALKHEYDITSLRQPTCEEKGIKEVTCKHCADEIVTYIDATGHNYEVTGETAATCEQDGAIVSTCANCGGEQIEVIPAIGHAFGVYAPAGDGTHVAECNTCGATRVRNCEYQDVVTNGITLTVCSVCGHTRYALLPVTETVAAVETTEAADATETDVKPDTLFVPAKMEAVAVTVAKGEELSGAQVVVYDQTAMLQEGSPILAMYTLGLESDGYAVKPTEALRIELPLTEEQTAETFEGYKLVIIAMDGTMTEIEYVIEEDKIIFETDLVGILAFLPIEE